MSIVDRFRLDERVALVTGGGSGIGQALAEGLASAGAAVIVVGRRRDPLDQAAAEIAQAGGRAAAVTADVADYRNLSNLVARAGELFGAPDILVNAAGINIRQPADTYSPDAWDQTLAINLSAPFFLGQALVPGMAEKGRGRIINIASLQSGLAFPDSAAYGASKGGIAQITRAMAEAWSARGINTNAIAPGFFPTDLTSPVFADTKRTEALAERTMIGRNGRLEDLQGLAVYLASPASDYVTGQVIYVDGGFTAK